MSYRVIVIDESDEDEHVLMLNEEVEEDVADAVVEMVEEGEIETFEDCSTVCNCITEMLKEAGVAAEDHDAMIEELEGMRLVKKVVEGEKEEKRNGGNGKKKKVVKKK